MIKEGQPQRHEFWLKKYSLPSDPELTHVYRVALGELIEAKDRQTFPPADSSKSVDFWNKSGSIGFMDVIIRDESVPKEGAKPHYTNPLNPHLKYFYLPTDCETVRSLLIQWIGIEPNHRGKGYARLLKERAEEIAREWGLTTVVAEMIQSPIMKELNVKLGYILYGDTKLNAVKRLQTGTQRD